jgi:NADH:ubiquinone oxidoreductase subunit H
MSAKVYVVPFNWVERKALANSLKRLGVNYVRRSLYMQGLDEVVANALIKNTLKKYGW